MREARWVIGTRFPFPYPQRIFGVEVEYSVVFHVNLRDTIVGGRQQEATVKSDLQRAGLEFIIPIRPFIATKPKVPFTDDGSFISCTLQNCCLLYTSPSPRDRG